jgi:hypothetical protein
MVHRPVALLTVLAACTLLACSDDVGTEIPGGDGGSRGEPECGPGELLLEDESCAPADPYPCEPGELALDGGGCLQAGVQDNGCLAGQYDDGGGCRMPGLPPDRCDAGDDGGCEPILPSAPCAAGELALPGETSCRPIADCGTGTWGNIPTDSTSVFVDNAYTGGNSDGSQNAPHTSISAALSAAQPGDLIAIAAGTHTASSRAITKPVRLWGRCPQMVTIEGTATNQPALYLTGQDGTEIHGISVTGASHGLAVLESSNVLVDQVWIHDTAKDGFNSWDWSSVTLRNSLIEHVASTGVFLYAADAVVESTVVRDVLPADNDLFGNGALAFRADEDGARSRLTMRDSLVDGVSWSGIAGVGSDLIVERTVVQRVTTDFQGNRGIGVELVINNLTNEASTLELRESVVADCTHSAVSMWGSNGVIEGSVMRNVSPADIPGGGSGVLVSADPSTVGGNARIVGSLVIAAHEHGIWLDGGNLELDGVLVSDSIALSGEGPGHGLIVTPGSVPAVATVRSSRVERSRDGGILAFDSQLEIFASIVDATDVNAATGAFGDGILVVRQGDVARTASIAGSVISTSMRAGLTTFGTDVTLRGTSLECNPISLTGSDGGGAPYSFVNAGGNRCGCQDNAEACRVLTAGVSAPAAIDPTIADF